MATTSQSPNGDSVSPTLFWSRKWSDTQMSFEIVITASIVSGIVGVVGGVSNAVVMYIIIQIRKHQERMNVDILILSLCFSDFLSSVAVQPLLIAHMLTSHPSRTLPQLLLLQIISHCTLLSGSLGLFVVTLERFINIRFPFLYSNHNTKVTTYISLVFIWAITILLAAWVILDGEGESRGFPIVISVVFFLTMLLQIMIYIIVHGQKRNIRRQVMAVQHNHQHNENQNNISHIASQTNANRCKTNRTILYLCIVFISGWLPSILFRLYYAISGNGSTFLKWVVIFRITIQVHSCINPCIYSLRTARVKRALFRHFGLFQRQ
jgi:hypothetical protein